MGVWKIWIANMWRWTCIIRMCGFDADKHPCWAWRWEDQEHFRPLGLQDQGWQIFFSESSPNPTWFKFSSFSCCAGSLMWSLSSVLSRPKSVILLLWQLGLPRWKQLRTQKGFMHCFRSLCSFTDVMPKRNTAFRSRSTLHHCTKPLSFCVRNSTANTEKQCVQSVCLHSPFWGPPTLALNYTHLTLWISLCCSCLQK